MIYVFDTNTFSEMSPFVPDVFPTLWERFDAAVAAGEVTSTREVLQELGSMEQLHVHDWCKANRHIFVTPDAQETAFVGRIFGIPHFGGLIGEKARLRGTPVADPFLIARAAVLGGTVVSEESAKPNKPNIPAVCQHFGVPCLKLADFLRAQGWTF